MDTNPEYPCEQTPIEVNVDPLDGSVNAYNVVTAEELQNMADNSDESMGVTY